MKTTRLFTILTLLSPLLLAAAEVPAPAPAYNEVVREAEGLVSARRHGEALRLLGGAAARDDLTAEQRRSLAFRAAGMIHSADQAVYPLLRETLEKLLEKVPLDDAGKLRLLEGIEGTYARTRNPEQAAGIRKRMLDLSLPDAGRVQVLTGLAQIYIHQLRRLDEGRACYHESIPLLRKAADAVDDPVGKAARLAAIGDIYQRQTREPGKAAPLYEEAVALYQKALSGLQPRARTQALAALATLQGALGRDAEARASEALAVAEYVKILDAAGELPPEAWMEAAAPLEAMRILRQTADGCRRALALAERMLGMREEAPVRRALPGVLVEAESICRSGKDADLLQRVSWVIEQQMNLAPTPRDQHAIRLRLGESYFRIDRDLAKARHAFAAVAGDDAAGAADRETARLWCEMLADEG